MLKITIGEQQQLVFPREAGLTLISYSTNAKGEMVEKSSNVANFMPVDFRRVNMVNDGIITPFVKFIMEFISGPPSEPITVPLDNLESIDWFALNSRCLLNPTFPKAKECLAYIIRHALPTATEETQYQINRLGTHIIEVTPVFNAGDNLIWPDDLEIKPEVKWEPVPNTRLVKDPACSEQDAVTGMKRIIDLSYECGRIIFAHMLLYIMHAAFVVAGIIPKVFVFLFGKTGNKKTTYAAFQTQLYNRDKPLDPLVRLNASIPAAVKLLYEKDDCVVVLDDLFPAQATEIHRQQEKTLLEITRVIGDGIEPARMRGFKVAKAPTKCGVLATGEYYIGGGSDGARHLPVHMTTPIDNEKMTACQREPLILSTFYNYFIRWYITNFNDIVGLIIEWKEAYRGAKTGVHDRLQETQFCLEAAYKLFLIYCESKGFITRDAQQDQYYSFYRQLRTIVKEQDTRINKHAGISGYFDYVAIIRSLFHDNRFKLAESPKKIIQDEHDGVIHGDLLYLRRDKLMDKIHEIEPSADFNEVLDSIKRQQALKPGRDSNSIHLHGIKRDDGSRGGMRFYAIRLSKLR